MSILYDTIIKLCDEKQISGYKLCTDLGISKSILTDLKMGRKKTVNAQTASKIADYFGVSVSYLLGNDSAPDKSDSSPKLRSVSRLESSNITPDEDKAIDTFIQYLLDKKKK